MEMSDCRLQRELGLRDISKGVGPLEIQIILRDRGWSRSKLRVVFRDRCPKISKFIS